MADDDEMEMEDFWKIMDEMEKIQKTKTTQNPGSLQRGIANACTAEPPMKAADVAVLHVLAVQSGEWRAAFISRTLFLRACDEDPQFHEAPNSVHDLQADFQEYLEGLGDGESEMAWGAFLAGLAYLPETQRGREAGPQAALKWFDRCMDLANTDLLRTECYLARAELLDDKIEPWEELLQHLEAASRLGNLEYQVYALYRLSELFDNEGYKTKHEEVVAKLKVLSDQQVPDSSSPSYHYTKFIWHIVSGNISAGHEKRKAYEDFIAASKHLRQIPDNNALDMYVKGIPGKEFWPGMCKRTRFATLPWALGRNREAATEDELFEEELVKEHLGAWESATLGNINELFPLVPLIHSLKKQAKLDEAEMYACQLLNGFLAVSAKANGYDHLGVQALLDLSEIRYLRHKNDFHEHAEEFQAINQNLSTAEELAKSAYERLSVLWCRAFIAGKYWRNDFAKHKESLLQPFCQFLEMEQRLGPASKNRIQLLDQVAELFQVIQTMYIDLDDDWNALLWAERERTRDFLLRVFENKIQGAYDFKSDFESFDDHKDEEKGLQEIYSIIESAGSDTAFLILSIGIKNCINCYCVNEKSISRSVIPHEFLFDYLQRTRNAITERENERDLEHYLSILYVLFICPHEAWLERNKINRLIVVPAKEISWLPFSAFKYPGPSKIFNEATGEMVATLEDDEDGHYLIQKYQIAVVPSLRVFNFCKKRYDAQRKNSSATRVGLVVGNPKSNLRDLSGAQKEATAVKEVLEKVPGFKEVMHLEREQATRRAVAERLAKCDWAHFAAHAEVNEAFPEGAIVLANEDGVSAEGTKVPLLDNGNQQSLLQSTRLPAAAIAPQMAANANAVVMSCCESGLGEVHGEGVLGLPRAFHIAGVPACVASLWTVDDVVSEKLMEQFYENLLGHHDVGEALQNAILFMINNECPVYKVQYWAPFFVSGDPSVVLA